MPFLEVEERHDVFMQQRRIWVFAGAALLSLIAGYVNVVMLGFFAVPVSHMTGAVSHLGVTVTEIDGTEFLLAGSIIVGFFLGALLSGLILRDTLFRMRRRYGLMLIVEGLLLVLTMAFALKGMKMAVPTAAMACGLQNAMASSYRGLIIRTTHVTGIVTDLGALFGNWLRGRQIKAWKFSLLLCLLLAFFMGGLIGALQLMWFGMWALSAAAVICILVGTAVVFVVQPQGAP